LTGNVDASNSFWSGTNAARCSAYQGALAWSFNADGSLKVTFGGQSAPTPTGTSTTTPATTPPATTKPPTTTPPATTKPPTTTTPATTTAPPTTTPATTTAPPTTTPPATTTPALVTYNYDFESGKPADWSPSSGKWSVVTDGSKVYYQSKTAGLALAVSGTSTWTDQNVQAAVKPVQFSNTSEYVGIAARVQDASNYYVLTLRDANKIEIRKVVKGKSTLLASKAFTVKTGTAYTLRLRVNGSKLTGYVNGSQKLNVTDTTFTSGKVGLTTLNGSATFDQVAITVTG
jgi:pectate lyase